MSCTKCGKGLKRISCPAGGRSEDEGQSVDIYKKRGYLKWEKVGKAALCTQCSMIYLSKVRIAEGRAAMKVNTKFFEEEKGSE
jgi:hypothetical protein